MSALQSSTSTANGAKRNLSDTDSFRVPEPEDMIVVIADSSE